MALTKIDDRGLKTPIDLLDNEKIRFGTGNDLELYHDGTNSNLHNATGEFKIRGNDVRLMNAAGNEHMLIGTANGSVNLYYDNSKKFETTSSGSKTTGILHSTSTGVVARFEREGTANGKYDFQLFNDAGNDCSLALIDSKASATRLTITSAGNLKIPDNGKLQLGDGTDLQIYHDGSNSYVNNTGTGYLILQGNGSDDVSIRAVNGESGVVVKPNGGASTVELYYDNSKKFETTANGTKVGDQLYSYWGDDGDLWIGHNGSNSYIDNNVGVLYISSDYIAIGKGDQSEHFIYCTKDAAVEIYHNSSKKFETTSYGIKIPSYQQLGTSGTATANWHIGSESSDGSFRFFNGNYGAGTEVLRLKYTGDVSIADGNLVVASGHGIDFSATSHATGMSSELFDSYEEGTWSASVMAGSTNVSLSNVVSTYTRIGRQITCWFRFTRDETGSRSGDIRWNHSLPFTTSNDINVVVAGSWWLDEGGPSDGDSVGGVIYLQPNSNAGYFVHPTSNGQQASNRYLQYSEWSQSRHIYGSMVYYV